MLPLAFVAAAVTAWPALAQIPADLEAQIRAFAKKYESAYDQHDASAYAVLWSPDADAIILDNPHAVWRDAILSAQKAYSASRQRLE